MEKPERSRIGARSEWCRSMNAIKPVMSRSSERVPPASRPPSMPHPRASRWSSSTPAPSAGRAGASAASRIISVFRPAFPTKRSPVSPTRPKYRREHVAISGRPHPGDRNIEVLIHTEIAALYGGREKQLERVRWRNNVTGEQTEKPICHVFLFIGAEPATNWLRGREVALDTKNYILAGLAHRCHARFAESVVGGVCRPCGQPIPLGAGQVSWAASDHAK
jgi:hypothetical protein